MRPNAYRIRPTCTPPATIKIRNTWICVTVRYKFLSDQKAKKKKIKRAQLHHRGVISWLAAIQSATDSHWPNPVGDVTSTERLLEDATHRFVLKIVEMLKPLHHTNKPFSLSCRIYGLRFSLWTLRHWILNGWTSYICQEMSRVGLTQLYKLGSMQGNLFLCLLLLLLVLFHFVFAYLFIASSFNEFLVS